MVEFKANYKNSDFLLTFMDLLLNKCLLRHYHESNASKFFTQNVKEWIQTNKNSFIQLVGENFYSVILSYCENKLPILDPKFIF